MDNFSVIDYSEPVHRVLLMPNQLLGIGTIPAVVIFIVSVILINMVSVWCIIIGVALFIAARFVCRKDPYMLTILFNRVLEPEIWRCG